MKPNQMSRFDRLMNSPGRALGDAGRSMLYRYKRKALKGAKTLPRKFAGALVGGSLATIGAGVGLASGDPSKAFQYAMAAGTAGYSGTNFYANKIGREMKEARKDADEAFFGSDLKARNQYLYDKEWKKNSENINKLASALGSRTAAKEAIKDNSVQAFLNSNVVDPSKVGKALKLRDKLVKEKGMDPTDALKRAVLIAQWNRDSGKGIYEKNSRAQQVWKDQTFKQFMDRGMDEDTARNAVDDILNNMEYLEF